LFVAFHVCILPGSLARSLVGDDELLNFRIDWFVAMDAKIQFWHGSTFPDVFREPNYNSESANWHRRDGASDNSDAGTIRFPQAKDTVTRQDETRSQVLVPKQIRRPAHFRL
jgi:hypothetical protein